MKNLFRVQIMCENKLLSVAYFSDWDDAFDYMHPYLEPRSIFESGFQVCVDNVEVEVHVL